MLELELVAAPRSASVPRPEAGPEAAAVTVGVTVVGPAAAAGPGADPEFEPVPVEGEPLPVGAAPGDSTAASNCLAPDMAARTPSGAGAGAVAPVALVEAEAVLGVGVAFGVALPHMRHFGLGWRVGRQGDHPAASACTQPGRLGTCHILPGHMRLRSTRRSAAGRLVDHNQVVAVLEHATRRVGTQTALVGKADVVVHKLPMYQC